MLLPEQGILLLPIPPQAFPRTWCLLLWCDRSDSMEATSCGAEVLREATRAGGWGKNPMNATWDGLRQQQPPWQAEGW